MERARWKAPAASRVDLVGDLVGSPVGRALASEESCVDCNVQPAMGKEPVLVISTKLHHFTPAFLRKNSPLERSNESSVGIRVCERNCVSSLLPVVVTQCRCAMVRQSIRFHRQEVRQHLRSSPLLWCTATACLPPWNFCRLLSRPDESKPGGFRSHDYTPCPGFTHPPHGTPTPTIPPTPLPLPVPPPHPHPLTQTQAPPVRA